MGGGGAGPPANRGPRVVGRAYKAAISGIFSLSLLIMQQHLTEAVAGVFSRCLGFCGMRPRLLTRHWCIAGASLQKVSSGARCFKGWRCSGWRCRARWVMLDLGGARQGLVPSTFCSEDAVQDLRAWIWLFLSDKEFCLWLALSLLNSISHPLLMPGDTQETFIHSFIHPSIHLFIYSYIHLHIHSSCIQLTFSRPSQM